MKNQVRDSLLGMAIGSALGLPYNTKYASSSRINPITDLLIDEDNQNALWSNDISLAFCLADALTEGYDLNRIIDFYLDWFDNNLWSVTDRLLDKTIDTPTYKALEALKNNTFRSFNPERDLTNGSLKRILPIVFYTWDKPLKVRFEIVKELTELTHPDKIAVLANFYLVEFARYLLMGDSPRIAYLTLQEFMPILLKNLNFTQQEIEQFWRLFNSEIWHYDKQNINPSINPIDSLEAALWAFLSSDSLIDAILTAVNLGGNPETLGAITGGLAALYYGIDNIPRNWLNNIALKDKIEQLSEALYRLYLKDLQNKSTITAEELL